MTGSTSTKPSNSNNNSKDEEDQIEGLAELKLALRALRAAMSFALPWNRIADAILGFMEQSNYCNAELGGNEKQARTLTRLVDYILEENANRWRGKQAFISTGELKEAWSSFHRYRDILYTNIIYTLQSLYITKFIQTLFIR